ncbi:zinc ribbon domain-containing protein [Pseudoscardovia radai]|uniref:zinc ribbon domain-containing protein n=1 Tax=Pseudoscardovia radai TaxID=987066 RepID=UPI003992CF1F
MYCPQCGTICSDGARFCTQCGFAFADTMGAAGALSVPGTSGSGASDVVSAVAQTPAGVAPASPYDDADDDCVPTLQTRFLDMPYREPAPLDLGLVLDPQTDGAMTFRSAAFRHDPEPQPAAPAPPAPPAVSAPAAMSVPAPAAVQAPVRTPVQAAAQIPSPAPSPAQSSAQSPDTVHNLHGVSRFTDFTPLLDITGMHRNRSDAANPTSANPAAPADAGTDASHHGVAGRAILPALAGIGLGALFALLVSLIVALPIWVIAANCSPALRADAGASLLGSFALLNTFGLGASITTHIGAATLATTMSSLGLSGIALAVGTAVGAYRAARHAAPSRTGAIVGTVATAAIGAALAAAMSVATGASATRMLRGAYGVLAADAGAGNASAGGTTAAGGFSVLDVSAIAVSCDAGYLALRVALLAGLGAAVAFALACSRAGAGQDGLFPALRAWRRHARGWSRTLVETGRFLLIVSVVLGVAYAAVAVRALVESASGGRVSLWPNALLAGCLLADPAWVGGASGAGGAGGAGTSLDSNLLLPGINATAAILAIAVVASYAGTFVMMALGLMLGKGVDYSLGVGATRHDTTMSLTGSSWIDAFVPSLGGVNGAFGGADGMAAWVRVAAIVTIVLLVAGACVLALRAAARACCDRDDTGWTGCWIGLLVALAVTAVLWALFRGVSFTQTFDAGAGTGAGAAGGALDGAAGGALGATAENSSGFFAVHPIVILMVPAFLAIVSLLARIVAAPAVRSSRALWNLAHRGAAAVDGASGSAVRDLTWDDIVAMKRAAKEATPVVAGPAMAGVAAPVVAAPTMPAAQVVAPVAASASQTIQPAVQTIAQPAIVASQPMQQPAFVPQPASQPVSGPSAGGAYRELPVSGYERTAVLRPMPAGFNAAQEAGSASTAQGAGYASGAVGNADASWQYASSDVYRVVPGMRHVIQQTVDPAQYAQEQVRFQQIPAQPGAVQAGAIPVMPVQAGVAQTSADPVLPVQPASGQPAPIPPASIPPTQRSAN